MSATPAYAGTAIAGYTRASVYLPIYENNILPALKSAKITSITVAVWESALWESAVCDTEASNVFIALKKSLEI